MNSLEGIRVIFSTHKSVDDPCDLFLDALVVSPATYEVLQTDQDVEALLKTLKVRQFPFKVLEFVPRMLGVFTHDATDSH